MWGVVLPARGAPRLRPEERGSPGLAGRFDLSAEPDVSCPAAETEDTMPVAAFEPKFMKIGVLTAALQELTPREKRDPTPTSRSRSG